MRRWILPGLVLLTLLVTVGVFVYFSPGEEETVKLLSEVKLDTPAWDHEDLGKVLVQMQQMIRRSHPRLRRFRLVYLEGDKSVLPLPGMKVWLPDLHGPANECLRYATEISFTQTRYHPGWVSVTGGISEDPFANRAAATPDQSSPSYFESYVWPGRPRGVDEVR